MCLNHEKFLKLLHNPQFSKDLLAIVIDKAHCISQWGNSFHKKFAELSKLRSYVLSGMPFLAVSATLPPHVLDEVKAGLAFSPMNTFTMNLGNWDIVRPSACSVSNTFATNPQLLK
jgi:superfamily II DNA helicase RecQ